MIRLEDRELEQFSLRDGYIAVPIEVYLPAGATEPEILAYESFRGVAEKYEKLYAHSPFSAAALRFLKRFLNPLMEEYEMTPSPDRCLTFLEYRADPETALNPCRSAPEATLIRDPAALASMRIATSQSPELSGEDDDVCAAVVLGNKLVAYAEVNDYRDDAATAEITTECAVNYRKRGFASSCVSALTAELLKNCSAVTYICRTSNAASQRVAEKVGFTLTGTRLSLVYYRT